MSNRYDSIRTNGRRCGPDARSLGFSATIGRPQNTVSRGRECGRSSLGLIEHQPWRLRCRQWFSRSRTAPVAPSLPGAVQGGDALRIESHRK